MKKLIPFLLILSIFSLLLLGCQKATEVVVKEAVEKQYQEKVAPTGGQGELTVNGQKISFDSVQAEIMLNEVDQPTYDYTTSVILTKLIPKKGLHQFAFSITTDSTHPLRGKYTTLDRYGDADAVTVGFSTFEEGRLQAKNYVASVWSDEKGGFETSLFEIIIEQFEEKEGAKISGTFKGTLIDEENLADKITVEGTFSSVLSLKQA